MDKRTMIKKQMKRNQIDKAINNMLLTKEAVASCALDGETQCGDMTIEPKIYPNKKEIWNDYYEGMFGSLTHNIFLMLNQITGNSEYSAIDIIPYLEKIESRIKDIKKVALSTEDTKEGGFAEKQK